MEQDKKPLEDNKVTEALSVGESRRRFVKGTLAAAPVLMTVVSRPAWGNICSISGTVSGNASTPGADPSDCDTGLSPDEYIQVQSNGQYELIVPFPSSGLDFDIVFQVDKPNKTLEVVLTKTTSGSWKYTNFERAAVAAYANAELGKTTFLSTGTVYHMVHDVLTDGVYQAAPGVGWNASDVLAYFMFTWGEGPLAI